MVRHKGCMVLEQDHQGRETPFSTQKLEERDVNVDLKFPFVYYYISNFEILLDWYSALIPS